MNSHAMYLPTQHQQFFSIICALLLLGFILYLVQKRTIREEYSLLWLGMGIGILILTLAEDLLLFLLWISGVGLASSILFLFAILFILLVLIHLTAVISEQRKAIKTLSINIALLEERLRDSGEK